MTTVLLDGLTVSVPSAAGSSLRDATTDVCLSVPGSQTDPFGARLDRWGILYVQDRGSVTFARASGWMLAGLRAAGLLQDYLAAVASCGPHRVTNLHAAHDVDCDPPARLAQLYALVRSHGVALTRKRLRPRDIHCIFSAGDDGRDTGSIMLGHRKRHETTACVYDRQKDAQEKGKPDPGPLVRYELRTGVDGLTLRDAADPAPVFFNFMGALLPRPDDVAAWKPHGEGYQVTRLTPEPIERLQRLVDSSRDVDRMLRLVDQLPGEGLDAFLRILKQRYRIHQRTLEFAAMRRGSSETVADPPG